MARVDNRHFFVFVLVLLGMSSHSSNASNVFWGVLGAILFILVKRMNGKES